MRVGYIQVVLYWLDFSQKALQSLLWSVSQTHNNKYEPVSNINIGTQFLGIQFSKIWAGYSFHITPLVMASSTWDLGGRIKNHFWNLRNLRGVATIKGRKRTCARLNGGWRLSSLTIKGNCQWNDNEWKYNIVSGEITWTQYALKAPPHGGLICVRNLWLHFTYLPYASIYFSLMSPCWVDRTHLLTIGWFSFHEKHHIWVKVKWSL